MTIANVKGLAAKFMITGLVAGAFTLASTAKADAQQFGVAVEFGHPAYVSNYDGYGQYRDGYRVDRDDYRRNEYRVDRDDYRRQEEFRERQERAEYLRRREYIRHEQREQWERYHGDDRPYGYR